MSFPKLTYSKVCTVFSKDDAVKLPVKTLFQKHVFKFKNITTRERNMKIMEDQMRLYLHVFSNSSVLPRKNADTSYKSLFFSLHLLSFKSIFS